MKMGFSLFQEGHNATTVLLLQALTIFIVLFIIIFLTKWVSFFILEKIGKKHPLRASFVEVFPKISWFSNIVIPLFFASLALPFLKEIHIFFSLLFAIALAIEIGSLAKVILMLIIEKTVNNQDTKTKKNMSGILNTILQVGIWAFALLIFFQEIGVQLTPLLASLGVGGIAVAFASQRLLEDFFSSFSIMGSSPFRIGDIITVEGNSGTVKKIGLRTTTIQTIEGSSVIIPNRTLVGNIIENSGTVKKRRKRFTLNITYETPVEKLRKIPNILKEIIVKYPKITFERVLVKELAASSIEVLVSYVVEDDDRLLAVQTHDQILIEILEVFEKKKISFAYPTQTVKIEK